MPFLWSVVFVFMAISGFAAESTISLQTDWLFKPDPDDKGSPEAWYALDYDDSAWSSIDAGKRWEAQGFPDVDGFAWYRKWVDVPAEWDGKDIWFISAGINDSYVLYCNGTRVNSFGDEGNVCTAELATAAILGGRMKPGEKNLLAIRVLDWGNSGGLWNLPCILTTDPGQLDMVVVLKCYPHAQNKKLLVIADTTALGSELKPGKLDLEIGVAGKTDLNDKHSIRFESGKHETEASFKIRNSKAGDEVHVVGTFRDASGNKLIKIRETIIWPSEPKWPAPYNDLKIRNNFVTEILECHVPGKGELRTEFLNPRDGWVFFSVAESANDNMDARLVIDRHSDPLVLRKNPQSGAAEAMQFLPEGIHRLHASNCPGADLSIRTVPEMVYSQHPSGPHLKPYGVYDWDYLTKYVLSNVNTLVTSGSVNEAEAQQWAAESRKWLVHGTLPGLGHDEAAGIEDVYQTWVANPGVTNPNFHGIIVDEFLNASREHYASWLGGYEKVRAHENFNGKHFYAYCTAIFQQPGSTAIPFGQALMKQGEFFALERYMPEKPTEKEAHKFLLDHLQTAVSQSQRQIPGWERNLIMCLGYLSAPPETLNIYPHVDYKVYMDMQFQFLATDPTFWRLYGMMEYLSSYADEEDIRWAHRLFRHYCIEGNTELLSRDPYILPHLKNPDFADGTSDWEVESALPDSVRTDSMEGFSWLQGRYPDTPVGDNFVVLVRDASKPNQLRQKIRKLQPGRLYSVKFISADLNNLADNNPIMLNVALKDTEIIEPYCFQFAYPSCYSHELGPYNRSHPAWMNYHRFVFRPKRRSSEITISDWAGGDNPGGAIGQNTAINFIEIQPFLEP